jgi:hypothetical protein
MINSIDRIIDFIAHRDPKFPEQIRGASRDEIARLEQSVSNVAPPVYRRFLERMGHSMAWVEIGNGYFDIATLIRYHEYEVLNDPPGYLLFGRGGGDPRYDYYLWETTIGGDNETVHRVVSFPPPPIQNFEAFARHRTRYIAGSLPQLIGDAALSVFCNHRLTYHRQVEEVGSQAVPRLRGLDDLMRQYEAPPLWFSNDWHRTYERPDLLVTAMESPATARLIVDMRAATQAVFDAVYPRIRDYVRAGRAAAR